MAGSIGVVVGSGDEGVVGCGWEGVGHSGGEGQSWGKDGSELHYGGVMVYS